jgi:hypothetical protein
MNVHVISADPNQRVGSAPTPTASDYQEGQGWDRINALRAELQELPARRDELRRAAAQRYWAWATGQVLAAADIEIDELHRAAQEAERHNKSLTPFAGSRTARSLPSSSRPANSLVRSAPSTSRRSSSRPTSSSARCR